jgi:hypothetical protein
VELLEDRLVPATHVWTGAGRDGLASNPANWNGGPIGIYDDFVFDPNMANTNATFDAAFPVTDLHSIQILPKFTATVEVATNLSLSGPLSVQGGPLPLQAANLQLDAGNTLVVDSPP